MAVAENSWCQKNVDKSIYILYIIIYTEDTQRIHENVKECVEITQRVYSMNIE